jgi:broad specificity phosphatase PhoE
MRVVLVRHAQPAATADRPPAAWALSCAGRAAAADLRTVLPGDGRWVCSPERKAVETLQIAAQSSDEPVITTDPGFGEVRRPVEPFDEDVHARRRAWVENRLDIRHAGWETPEGAAERFADAVARHASARPLVIGTHGMVLTAWLVLIGRVEAGRPAGDLWSGLRFPDAVLVETPELRDQ